MKTQRPHPILVRLMPYLMIAFAILIFVLALFVFSYILIAAVVIGLIVFIVRWVRVKFFGHKKKTPEQKFRESFFIIQTNMNNQTNEETKKPSENSGRIIEHDDHPL